MRVIAGAWKGHPLKAPPGRSRRPTADRTREALFSILGDITGSRVLDLYAGSGALGIEALSRGAAEALFVESSRRPADTLRANLRAVGGPAARVSVAKVLPFLEREQASTPYDLVFAAPPYSSAPRLGERLSQLLPGVLHPSSLTVTESD